MTARALRLLAATLLALPPAALAGQEPGADVPPPIEDFAGWEEWPIYEAGELAVEGAPGSHRGWYRMRTPTGDTLTVRLDVWSDVFFQGEPAFWIQHTSRGSADGGTSALDAMIVDRETFRVLFRVGAAGGGGGEWAGRYDVTQHRPGHVVRTSIADDGSVTQNQAFTDSDPFDFVAMPYLVALSGLLEEGRRFRLMNVGSARSPEPRPVGILVRGRTTIRDAAGREHDGWDVQLVSNSGQLLIDFMISEAEPYFLGWRFRPVAPGRPGLELLYLDHTSL